MLWIKILMIVKVAHPLSYCSSKRIFVYTFNFYTLVFCCSPQPTEVGQYKNNSCTLKPKTEFSFFIKNSTEFFFEFE